MSANTENNDKKSDQKTSDTTQTSVRVFTDQKEYLENNNYNLSKITRKAINKYMLEIYGIDLHKLKLLKDKKKEV